MTKILGDLLGEISAEFSVSIASEFKNNQELSHQAVQGITSDSRAIRRGSVFVAIHGGAQDGHQFVESAAQAGAICIIGEKSLTAPKGVPYIQVPDSRKALAFLASQYFGNPTGALLVIGVTGTSGKTTTTYLIESILQAAGHAVGVIGTVNFRFGSKIFPSTHTTPGPVELQQLLKQMKDEGCTAVVMEVSSHALKQHRVGYVAFDGMVFTNLSPEHLDFHPDMEDYFHSKAMLFREYADYALSQNKSPALVVNEGDSYGKRLLQELNQKPKNKAQIVSFGLQPDFRVTLNGIQGKLKELEISSPLTGEFNVWNISAAVTLAQGLKLPHESIQNGVTRLRGIPGRLERVENSCGLHIWVDYAHKPDALEKVVKTLQKIKGGHQLITVFGCGGDRDRKKRPLMGKIAVEGSDQVWITSDNPRTEDPIAIIQEILIGTQGFQNFQVEPDRKAAIDQAIQNAKPGDLVLIAGKGHEDYQILGTTKIHFDDREIASEACSARFNSR